MRGLPLLQQREEIQTVAIVPFTGDRGLAGAFNAQVMRRAFALERELEAEGQEVRWLVVGKKGALDAALPPLRAATALVRASPTGPTYGDAQAIAHRLAELYTSEEVDRVILVYNHFVSPLVAARDRAGRPADLRAAARARGEDEPEERARRGSATSSSSPSRRRSSRGCCRSTSRRSSTGRCSSRRRPSRARG